MSKEAALKAANFLFAAIGIMFCLIAAFVGYEIWKVGAVEYTNEVVITDPYSKTQRCIQLDTQQKVWKDCK